MQTASSNAIINATVSHPSLGHDGFGAIIAILYQLEPSDTQAHAKVAPFALCKILASIQANQNDENLHLVATGAIQFLTYTTNGGLNLIKSGGLPLLMTSVTTFPDHIGIQDAVASTIGNLLHCRGAVSYPEDADGFCVILLSSLVRHASWMDGRFQLKALKTLHYIAHYSDRAREEMISADGVLLLSMVEDADAESPAAKEAGCLLRLLEGSY